MSRFTRSAADPAFLKMGILGFAGAGKTRTATNIARGLCLHLKDLGLVEAPKVFFLDTEGGSDYIRHIFEDVGIELYQYKTRAFKDLIPAVKEAEELATVLVIDSITHFWREFMASASAAKKGPYKDLTVGDWRFLKTEWGQFTELFTTNQLHIILAGRAKYEYEYTENDKGKTVIERTGTAMSAESDMAFEPSLLMEMTRVTNPENRKETWRIGRVIKDRFGDLDGLELTNPDWMHFQQHIERLNLGGKLDAVDTQRDSADIIPLDFDKTDRLIVLDEIRSHLLRYYPSRSAEDRKNKEATLGKAFPGKTWTEIEKSLPLDELQHGYDELHRILEDGMPSKYATEEPEPKEGTA
jgi:hypothetical protein